MGDHSMGTGGSAAPHQQPVLACLSSIHMRYVRKLCFIYRARAHALKEQLQRDGALAVREALHFEALQDGESAKEIGKSDNTNKNTTKQSSTI